MNRLNNFKVCLFRADHPADLGQSTTLAIFKMPSSKLRRKAFRDFNSPRPQKGDISESPVCFTGLLLGVSVVACFLTPGNAFLQLLILSSVLQVSLPLPVALQVISAIQFFT